MGDGRRHILGRQAGPAQDYDGGDLDEQDRLREAKRKALEEVAAIDRGVANRMGVKDPGADARQAALAAINGLGGDRPGGVRLAPNSFSAPRRPLKSVTSLWRAPERNALFQNPVTGLASGSLLDDWGADGRFGTGGASRPLSSGRAAPAPADPAMSRGGFLDWSAWPETDNAPAPSSLPAPSPGYDPSLAGDDYSGVPLGPRLSDLPQADMRDVGGLLRDSATYGSMEPYDLLDAANAFSRIRARRSTGGRFLTQ